MCDGNQRAHSLEKSASPSKEGQVLREEGVPPAAAAFSSLPRLRKLQSGGGSKAGIESSHFRAHVPNTTHCLSANRGEVSKADLGHLHSYFPRVFPGNM